MRSSRARSRRDRADRVSGYAAAPGNWYGTRAASASAASQLLTILLAGGCSRNENALCRPPPVRRGAPPAKAWPARRRHPPAPAARRADPGRATKSPYAETDLVERKTSLPRLKRGRHRRAIAAE